MPLHHVVVSDADFAAFDGCDVDKVLDRFRTASAEDIALSHGTHLALSQRAWDKYRTGSRWSRTLWVLLTVLWVVAWGGSIFLWVQFLGLRGRPLEPGWLGYDWVLIATVIGSSIVFIIPTRLLATSDQLINFVNALTDYPDRWREAAAVHGAIATGLRLLFGEQSIRGSR